jgi:membrane protease YdiL (CAAX protease family)
MVPRPALAVGEAREKKCGGNEVSSVVRAVLGLSGLWLAQQHHHGQIHLANLDRWYLALIPFLGFLLLTMVLTPFVGLRKDLSRSDVAKRLFFFLFLVGFSEELWFRGIWFAMFADEFWASVVLGSVVFGFMHYAPGVPGKKIDAMPMIILPGLVFATSRYCGAGILPLAIAHGLFNFLSLYLLEKTVPCKKDGQPGLTLSMTIVYVLGCLLLAALPFAIP